MQPESWGQGLEESPRLAHSQTKNISFSKRRDGDCPYPGLPTAFPHHVAHCLEIRFMVWVSEIVGGWAQPYTPASFTNTTHLLIPYNHIYFTTTLETAWDPPRTAASWWLTQGFLCCLHTLSRNHLVIPPVQQLAPEQTEGAALKNSPATKQNNLSFFITYSKRTGKTCFVLICFPNTYCLFLISAH